MSANRRSSYNSSGRSYSRSRSSGGSRRTQHRTREPVKRAPVAIALILVVGVLYFASAGAVGKWFADKVLTPIFGATSILPQATAFVIEPTATPNATEPASVEDDYEDITFELDAYYMYAIQLGAYDSLDNARVAAQEVERNGGAGFIWEDTLKRVFAAGYVSEIDAEKVKEQLAQSGVESTVYSTDAPGMSVSMTATRRQSTTLKEAFLAIEDVIVMMENLSIDYDKGIVTAAEAASRSQSSNQKMNEQKQIISELFVGSEEVPMISGLLGIYGKISGILDEFSSGKHDGTLSVKLKYERINLASQYITLRKELSM